MSGPWLRYVLVVGGAVCSILLFLLATASNNSGFFDRNYAWLLGLNAAVAVALLIFVIVMLGRLYSRYKSGKFGSKLMARLMVLFSAIGVLPGVLIFVVSVQFVSHSIDSWFNVRIDAALDSGLKLSHSMLDGALKDLTVKARETAATLDGQTEQGTNDIMQSMLTDDSGLQDILILDAEGKVLASAVEHREIDVQAERPTASMLEEAKRNDVFASLEGGSDPSAVDATQNALDAATSLRLRVVVPIPTPAGGTPRFLQLLQAVPPNLAANAQVLGAAYSEYKMRSEERTGLRKMYIETLTLTLLLAIFGAIGSAFLIAGNLAQPLLVLAEGTRAVAEGDLSPRPIVATPDELGTLTQSFNAMTGQLFEARSAVERNRAALQSAKAHLESVLENMSAGVIVLDAEFNLVNANEAAERILETSVAGETGRALAAIEGLEPFSAAIGKAFSAQSAQSAAGSPRLRAHWQQQLEIPRRNAIGDDQDLTLLARGSRLPVRAGSGFIVVFDDISDVIAAQRSIAWGEVARRLAHEIKNPLTPIQLSAERMQMKLQGRLQEQDMELVNRATTTIVNQVDAMKRMVDDFRDYARTPPAMLQQLDLNGLIREILNLYLSGDANDIIHAQLAAGLPEVMGDPTQLRQVIHNLLQNAQDAMQDRGAAQVAPPRIDVVTETIHYQNSDGGKGMAVRLAIKDNGPGFAPKILARAFEPYVTSKARGTGLGLPMVKKIIDEHGGKIDIHNHGGGEGATISILLLKLAPAPNLATGPVRA
jgi:nitrogen fixation/metabolism regulation signal transduction histidine kinase